MGEFIFVLLFTMFGVYGIIVFLIEILSGMGDSVKSTKDSNIKIVVFVKGAQSNIEGVIREIVYKSAFRGSLFDSIYIVGKDMNEETKEIIKRLEKEYSFVRAVDSVEGIAG